MDNIIVSASNLYALFGSIQFYKNGEYINSFLINCAMISSILYHLAESNKHNMTGIYFLKPYEKKLLNIDRFFAISSVLIFSIKYWLIIFNNSAIMNIIPIGLFSLILSEFPNYSPVTVFPKSTEKIIFIISHCIWHLCAFHVGYLLAIN